VIAAARAESADENDLLSGGANHAEEFADLQPEPIAVTGQV
jgi:hypothetical protein